MRVAIANVSDYNYAGVRQGLDEVLTELGGIAAFINPGDKVLIKPNMVDGASPDRAVTTHPEVIRAVIRVLSEMGAIAVVGDSPGVIPCYKAAERSGILAVCQEEKIQLLPFTQTTELVFPAGRTLKKVVLAGEIKEVDKIISLAKMKTHTLMGVTGAVKNLFGFIVGPQKAQFHLRMKNRTDFAAMLIDLNELIKPVLYIVDGIVGMEGDGPRNGLPKRTGIILAGANGYAVDLVMADKMGFPAEKMPIAAQALIWGLSPRLADVEVIGTGREAQFTYINPRTWESLDSHLPGWLVNFFQNQLTACPVVNESCIACGCCLRHCPPQAMFAIDGKVRIDYDRCIRCYCCQELCPYNAIKLKDGLLLRAVRQIW